MTSHSWLTSFWNRRAARPSLVKITVPLPYGLSSSGQQAAFNRKRDAGDVAAGAAGQEDQGRAEFVGMAEPAFQRARDDRAGDVIALELVGHFGLEVP